MKELIPFVVALLVVINPIGMLPIFYGLTDHLTTPERKRTARLTSFTIAVVLLLSLLGGTAILRFFGIDIDSFRVGGGIYLLLLGLKMLRMESAGTKQTGAEIQENSGVAIVPLGMPILAGPATISTAVLYAQQAKSPQTVFALVLGSLIVSAIVWMLLHIGGLFQDKINPLVLTSISRIMGLLLASLAIKFITVGLSNLLPGLLGAA